MGRAHPPIRLRLTGVELFGARVGANAVQHHPELVDDTTGRLGFRHPAILLLITSRALCLPQIVPVSFLWHGNVFRALQLIGDLEIDLDVDGAGPGRRKLVKTLGELGGYIGANAGSIPNYGERHRSGEAISNAFVESAVNQVVSKRMVKKQQMRWSQRGAHLLLQIRTRVLNDDLAGDFRRWYPAFMPASERQDVAA